VHDAVLHPRLGGAAGHRQRAFHRLRDRLLGVDVPARVDGPEDRLLAHGGQLRVEVERARVVAQRRVEVRRPAGQAVPFRHLGELGGVAADQDRLQLDP
jgi:hypothetical protein